MAKRKKQGHVYERAPPRSIFFVILQVSGNINIGAGDSKAEIIVFSNFATYFWQRLPVCEFKLKKYVIKNPYFFLLHSSFCFKCRLSEV